MNRINLLLTLVLAILVLVPAAAAQHQAISGYVVYVPGEASAVTLADGRTLSTSIIRGVRLDDDTGSPLHLGSQDCAGSNLFGTDGTMLQNVGSCTSVDADGDLLHLSYLNTPEQRTWRYTGGTGKFAGIEGGGTTELVAVGPDGRSTIRYDGTMTLR